VTLPVAEGANVTFRAAVCPGGTVVFALTPLTLKPGPVVVTLLMTAFALPVFVKSTPSELVLPTSTLPKSRLPVLGFSSGADETALPLVEIARGELGASLTSEIAPVTFPTEVGANTTLNVAFWPAAMLIGTVRPDVLNPAPVTFALEIVTLALPEFCSRIVWELVEPVGTPGKLAVIGVAASCGCCTCGCGVFVGGGVALGEPLLPEFDPMTTPAQPLPSAAAASVTPNKHTDILLTSDLLSAIVRQV
jgi:hypothetical protein